VIPDEIKATMEHESEFVLMSDLEKRKAVYGICAECNEPGTGRNWCRPCNAKRFKENFKNWSSGNKIIDELIQDAQLNAVHHTQCLEWFPFDQFDEVTYLAKGGFGKVYSAGWTEGFIKLWDIKKQKWLRHQNKFVALKSLNNSSNISVEFVNEVIN